jgi:hypothetical protein
MDELVNRFESFDMNDTRDNRQDNQNLVTKFLTEIDNDYQSDIILKLFCGYSGYSGNLYLFDYSKETNTVYILGSRSTKGRETYSVNIDKHTHSLTCNCKDFQFRAKRLDIVCKHIAFLVCKVGYILDASYFKSKVLTDVQYIRLMSILDNNTIWKNKFLSVKDINKEFEIKNNAFDSNDPCPICYDAYGDTQLNICCPQCKNYIHKKCMDIWLETNQNCVYCRSEIFSEYISDMSQI